MNALTPPGRSEILSRLRADLSERWQGGERPQVEEYLQLHPELADSPDLLDLVYAEMVLREQGGETPALGEYQARFPRHAEAIERQWHLHRLIQRGGVLTLAPGQTGPDPITEPLSPPPQALPPFPGLVLLDEVGRGGMGVVYRARQPDLDRVVAVKLVRTVLADSPEVAARFRTEARAVGRLAHPGVVRVFGFGEADGCLYLVMEYLPGGSLAQRLRAGPLPPAEAAALAARLARAVQAAHDARVLHRDLKPGNVLLGDGGEPKVGDFGLAKVLDADADQTHTGALIGTPAYMAPEQVEGAPPSPAIDVWALGAILYECLVGRPPFLAPGREATLRQVCNAAPAPPSRLRPVVPAPLEAICLRCLSKSPAGRYPSAGALADDLEAFLDGTLRPPARPRRWRAWAAGLAAALALAAVAAWASRERPDVPPAPRWEQQVAARLAAGQPVTLLGDRGELAGARWVVGEHGARLARADDGELAIDASTYALLELLLTVPLDRYRLRVELRHEKGYEGGEVGAYVGHQAVTLGGRAGHLFVQASYNDVSDAAADMARALKGLPVAQPPGPPVINSVELIPKVYLGTGWREGGHLRLAGAGGETFKAAGPAGGTWRALTLEVRPEGVKVLWGAPGKEVGALTPAAIDASTKRGLERDFPRDAPPTWRPHGGLGLLVDHGVVSARRVVVEPLPE